MEFPVLNKSFQVVGIIDDFESAIWTDRYKACGDFELTLSQASPNVQYLRRGYYLLNQESTHSMIIEDIYTSSDADEGSFIRVSGRSLESILDRRIVWGLQKISKKNIENSFLDVLNKAIISPTNSKRKISNFKFQSSGDSRITSIQYQVQYTGDNLYEIVTKLCEKYDIGFRIILDDNDDFVFSFYKGRDRSYGQNTRSYVVFSPQFDNIIAVDYHESDADYKNVTLIGGEGEELVTSASAKKGTLDTKGEEKTTRVYTSIENSSTGLNRRELFTDARDIQSERGKSGESGESKMSDEEYVELLQERGREKLSEAKLLKEFSGQADATTMYIYGTHFFMGDTVQLDDGAGHESPAQVIEMIMSQNTDDGYTAYPTFAIIDSEE